MTNNNNKQMCLLRFICFIKFVPMRELGFSLYYTVILQIVPDSEETAHLANTLLSNLQASQAITLPSWLNSSYIPCGPCEFVL